MNNNIAESYVSFEVAKLLKEKGFDVSLRDYYDNDGDQYSFRYYAGDGTGEDKNSSLHENDHYGLDYCCTAPTQSIVIEWLRVNFGIWVDLGWKVTNQEWSDEKPSPVKWWYMISKQMGNPDKTENNEYSYSSPQEAFEEGIKYTLKNLI